MESFFRKEKILVSGDPVLRTKDPASKPTKALRTTPTIATDVAFRIVVQVLAGFGDRLPPGLAPMIRQTIAESARRGTHAQDLREAVETLPAALQEKVWQGIGTGRWMFLLAEA